MSGIPNGIVAGWLKHGEQGPALAGAQAQAGLAPGQRSLEHHPGLGAGRVAAIHCECPLGRTSLRVAPA